MLCRFWVLMLCCFYIISPAGGIICLGSRIGSTCVSLEQKLRELIFRTVCYAKVGCFYSGPPFYHPIRRPFSIPPQSPEVLMPKFMLYTRRNRYKPQFLSDDDTRALKKSNFNPQVPTRIVTHGYVDGSGQSLWFTRFKNALLEVRDDNVIFFDWSGGSGISYPRSTANTRVAGALLANFIHFLCEKTGTRPEDIHLIGHSLGAHTVGYAGERVRNLGRITGLDPAAPGFAFSEPEVVLDPSDALFVDIIHTDRGLNIIDGLGFITDAGTIDFFPWDGKVPLSLCANRLETALVRDPPREVFNNVLICRHLISEEYLIYSFNQSNCLFVAAKCRSWKDFLAGLCDCGENGERCRIMGFYAKPPSPEERKDDLRYYLVTGLQDPYCLHQYRLQIATRNFHTSHKTKHEDYSAEIIIFGDESELNAKINLRINPKEHQQILKYLLINEKPLGHIHSAVIKFEDGGKAKNLTTKTYDRSQFSVDAIEVTYLYPMSKAHTRFFVCREEECTDEECEMKLSFKQDSCHSWK